MEQQLDHADALRDRLCQLVDQWTTEAATLVARRQQRGSEDRIYSQACRDHAADLAAALRDAK